MISFKGNYAPDIREEGKRGGEDSLNRQCVRKGGMRLEGPFKGPMYWKQKKGRKKKRSILFLQPVPITEKREGVSRRLLYSFHIKGGEKKKGKGILLHSRLISPAGRLDRGKGR